MNDLVESSLRRDRFDADLRTDLLVIGVELRSATAGRAAGHAVWVVAYSHQNVLRSAIVALRGDVAPQSKEARGEIVGEVQRALVDDARSTASLNAGRAAYEAWCTNVATAGENARFCDIAPNERQAWVKIAEAVARCYAAARPSR